MKNIYISQSEYVLYDEPVIIYGYGRQGKLLYRYLHRMKKKVLCIVDANKKGHAFCSIEKAVQLYPKATFVVAICDGKINKQVTNDLINNYKANKVIICDNYVYLQSLYTQTYKHIKTDGKILYEYPVRVDFFSKIKRIASFFKDIYNKGLLIVKNCRNIDSKKYNISLCLIFKDESVYLKEWIEYHLLIGCDHFYLYNNNSSDNYREVIKPYLKKGYITLINWPYEKKQIEAYIDCFNNFKNETKWIGFIDADEFIVPNHYDCIGDFFDKYYKYGSIFINWKCFGSNGIKSRNLKGLVIEEFTQSHLEYSSNGKCFVNTGYKIHSDMDKYRLIHHKCYVEDNRGKVIPPIDVFGNYMFYPYQKVKTTDFPIQINHYIHKSFDEYIERMNKSDVFFGMSYRNLELYYKNEKTMVETEKNIYKYLGKMKEKMR